MKQWQVESLRDFAIDHLPAAQAVRDHATKWGTSSDDYHHQLVAIPTLLELRAAQPVEQKIAAKLLCLASRWLLGSTYDGLNEQLVEAARNLCAVTGRTLPWLKEVATQSTRAATSPGPEGNQTIQPTSQPSEREGEWLTTEEAARLLRLQPQTLQSWSSKQTGPIQPRRLQRRLYWNKNEILDHLKKPTS